MATQDVVNTALANLQSLTQASSQLAALQAQQASLLSQLATVQAQIAAAMGPDGQRAQATLNQLNQLLQRGGGFGGPTGLTLQSSGGVAVSSQGPLGTVSLGG